MPRNFSKYQYETSPRKLEPEYTPVKNPYKKKKTTARKVQTIYSNRLFNNFWYKFKKFTDRREFC